jgi:hypothetical protein
MLVPAILEEPVSAEYGGAQKSESLVMRPHQLPKYPSWHQRASRAEVNEVASIDKLVADLRARRQAIVNRAHVRTRIWAKHHQEKKDGVTVVALVRSTSAPTALE